MLEALVIALLVWLWVIERRLNSLGEAVHSLRLDVDGLRALNSKAKGQDKNPSPAALSEVATIRGRPSQLASS
jgi:hypothetical protein